MLLPGVVLTKMGKWGKVNIWELGAAQICELKIEGEEIPGGYPYIIFYSFKEII